MNRRADASIEPPLQAFVVYIRVRFHEVDGLGHVNNAAYLNYLEQAAIDHATHLGLNLERLRALGGVFVARRHDIRFLQPAHAGDVLRIVTWLEEPRGARVERQYRIFREPEPPATIPVAGLDVVEAESSGSNSPLAVQAVTEWVFASETGRARRIPDEVLRAFRHGAAAEQAQNRSWREPG